MFSGFPSVILAICAVILLPDFAIAMDNFDECIHEHALHVIYLYLVHLPNICRLYKSNNIILKIHDDITEYNRINPIECINVDEFSEMYI